MGERAHQVLHQDLHNHHHHHHYHQHDKLIILIGKGTHQVGRVRRDHDESEEPPEGSDHTR